jgi:putative lipoic acid-binding regulatory protein
LGRDGPGFADLVAGIVAGHAPDSGEPDCRPSSNGRFISINISFTARSLLQLESIHLDLNACDRVTLVL